MDDLQKAILVVAVAVLSGCNGLGGIQPDLIDKSKTSGAYCFRVESLVMGKAVAAFASDPKSGNNNVSINTETCSITITTEPKATGAPGAPLTVTVPATITTTATPRP